MAAPRLTRMERLEKARETLEDKLEANERAIEEERMNLLSKKAEIRKKMAKELKDYEKTFGEDFDLDDFDEEEEEEVSKKKKKKNKKNKKKEY